MTTIHNQENDGLQGSEAIALLTIQRCGGVAVPTQMRHRNFSFAMVKLFIVIVPNYLPSRLILGSIERPDRVIRLVDQA